MRSTNINFMTNELFIIRIEGADSQSLHPVSVSQFS